MVLEGESLLTGGPAFREKCGLAPHGTNSSNRWGLIIFAELPAGSLMMVPGVGVEPT